MKRFKRFLTAGVVVMAVTLLLPFVSEAFQQQPVAGRIGVGAALLGDDHVIGNDVSAFVPTGSIGDCIATLSESNFAVHGTTLYCAPRIFDGEGGIFVHVFFPSPPPAELILVVTLYQEHAQGYGEPVFFPLEVGP